MNILNRALNIYYSEGLIGITLRIKQRLTDKNNFKNWKKKLFMNSDREFEYSEYGIKFKKNKSDATYKMYLKATYGYYYWNRISRLKHNFTFLDIGANQGLYTICAAKNPNSMNIYAFEPVAETYAYLNKNVQLNKVADKCTLINKAIANRRGAAQIAIVDGHSGAATIAEENAIFQRARATTAIELIDAGVLDNIVSAEFIPVVVKVDVEGHEPAVIEQLLKTSFSDRITEIFFEVQERWIDVEALKSTLRDNGFVNFTELGKGGVQYDILATRSS